MSKFEKIALGIVSFGLLLNIVYFIVLELRRVG
jgi:hypothetical protein